MQPIEPQRESRAFLDVLLCGAFLAFLVLPWTDELARTDAERGPGPELREAAPRPRAPRDVKSLSVFPEQYTAYFNDSFGLRDKLLRCNALIKYFGLGVSPTTQVVVGKDEWLFYAANSSIDVYRGLAPMSEAELASWRAMLEEKRRLLAERGAAYLLVIGPNKQSIYGERMPDRYNVLGPTRMDQFVEHMRAHSSADVLDLRDTLRSEKRGDAPDDFLFFPYGTHWYGRGALAAYRAILNHLAPRFPSLVPLPESELVRTQTPGHGDTWGQAMYIEDLTPQSEWVWRAKTPRAHTIGVTNWGPRNAVITAVDDASLPRALVFHDSFGPYLHQLLAEHFSHLCYQWQYEFDLARVEREKPDVVIEIFVERIFVQLAAANLLPEASTANETAFAQSKDVLYRLDVARGAGELGARGDVVFENVTTDGGPAIQIPLDSGEDLVLLPAFPFAEHGDTLVHLELDSPASTTLEMWYRFAGDSEYKRRNSIRAQVKSGRNHIYLRLNQPGLEGALLVRPGGEFGKYVLRAFEARAASE